MGLTSEKMKKLRERKKLSQAEVANFIGVSQASYGKYEAGRMKPKHDIYLELLELFGLDDNEKQKECFDKLKDTERELQVANDKIVYLEKIIALYERQENVSK